MSAYEKPMVLEEMDSFEGVFAESGDLNQGDLEITWRGHNSGGHSEVFAHANFSGLIHYYKADIEYIGEKTLVAVTEAQGNGATITQNGNHFTVVWEDANGSNLGSRDVCSFHFVFAPGPDETHADQGAYFPSGQNTNCSAADYFIGSLEYS